MNEQTNDLAPATEIGNEVLATDNIWTAIEVLTNRLGMKVGQHLETLLCKETASPSYVLVDSSGKVIPEHETDEERAEWERLCRQVHDDRPERCT